MQLAANGRGFTAPNPMVGAVIVAPDGRVIGEGWHRRYGEGHAEVNAVASVSDADRPLLCRSTIYVTLEPCSHYGKTPPCAELLIRERIPRVVVGAGDPNPKVNGRGIEMLRAAGAEVVTGVLARESIALNKVFFRSQTLHRPFVTLKLAQSQDGYMDAARESEGDPAYVFSTPLTRLTTMKMRAENEAILTTAATVIADNPRFTLRNWEGRQPRVIILDRAGRLTPQLRSTLRLFTPSDRSSQLANFLEVTVLDPENGISAPKIKVSSPESSPEVTVLGPEVFAESDGSLGRVLEYIYKELKISSVMVESGPRLLSSLVADGLWDELRVETAPVILGSSGRHPAPSPPPSAITLSTTLIGSNSLTLYSNPSPL